MAKQRTPKNVSLSVDAHNANRGTARGAALLKESIETCGLGRGIVADRHGMIIGGNKTFASAQAMGVETEVVETSGDALVVVQRTDLDVLVDAKAKQLAYYDNRVQELDLEWSAEQVQSDVLAGLALGDVFVGGELDAVVRSPRQNAAPEPGDAEAVSPSPVSDGLGEGVAVSVEVSSPTSGVVPAAAEATTEEAGRPSTFLLMFNTVEQQLRWGDFMRALVARYPEIHQPGARLAAYLRGEA